MSQWGGVIRLDYVTATVESGDVWASGGNTWAELLTSYQEQEPSALGRKCGFEERAAWFQFF